MSSLLAYYLYPLVQNLLGNQEDVHSNIGAAAKTLVATNILLVPSGGGEVIVRTVNLLTTCVGEAKKYPPLHLAAINWTVPVIGHPGAECANHSTVF
jgi:predicted Na+-dependent transporter